MSNAIKINSEIVILWEELGEEFAEAGTYDMSNFLSSMVSAMRRNDVLGVSTTVELAETLNEDYDVGPIKEFLVRLTGYLD